MSALAAVAEVHFDEEVLAPPRFTADGRPEKVARETRSNLGNIIDELSADDIKQIADSAEAHKQSGQRVFLEVAYGEPIGKTDAVLHFKKTGTDITGGITAAYTFYKDEEDGNNKRLLRELRRLEYLEKVVMRQLEMTDRTNSIGAVQGMIRSGSAFIKSLQGVFKQVETLANRIERGLQNKSEMPTAEQKTAAITTIQAALGKLQPLSTTHLSIKNMVQQQVDQLLKNVATPVAALRSDVKNVATPLPTVNTRNNAASAQPVTAPKTAPLSIVQATAQTTLQPALRSPAQTGLQAKAQETARPVTSTRFSVLTTLNVTERVTHAMPQTAINNATVVATSRLAASSAQQVDTRVAVAKVPTALRIVAANPEVQRTAALITRSSVTVIDSKAGQQVLSTLARINPTQPVATQPVASQPVAAQPVAAQPVAAHPVAAQPVAAHPVAAQPVAAQPVAAQPVAAQPVAAQPVAKIQQVASTQHTVTQPLAQPAQSEQTQATNATTNITRSVPVQPARQENTLPAEAKITALPTEIKSANSSTQHNGGVQEQQRATPADPSRPAADNSVEASQKQTEARQTGPEKTEPAKLKIPGLDKNEKDETDPRPPFKQEAKTACEACTTKDCANCGVKSATILGAKDTQIPVSGKLSGEQAADIKDKFAKNVDDCSTCGGGKCPGCMRGTTVTADTNKISSRMAGLKSQANTTPQHTARLGL